LAPVCHAILVVEMATSDAASTGVVNLETALEVDETNSL
jgi:hypothetical protein